jgi:hypothetical protein
MALQSGIHFDGMKPNKYRKSPSMMSLFFTSNNNIMHSPRTLLYWSLVLPMVLFWNSLSAQDSLFHAELKEIGLRINQINTSNSMDQFENREVNRSLQDIGLEMYGSKSIGKHNFVRLGLGYNLSHDHTINTFPVLPTATTTIETNDTKRHGVTYEIGIGHEFKRSSASFWERFRLRAGVSLSGNSGLFEKRHFTRETTSATAVVQSSQTTYPRNGFGINLNLNAFGQLGFRIHKGFFVGLEFAAGPNLNLGRAVSKQYFYTNVPSIGTIQVLNRVASNHLILDWRRILGGPKLLMSIAF